MRKKNSHITFLHVYHHGGMVLASYTVSKFVAGKVYIFLYVLAYFLKA